VTKKEREQEAKESAERLNAGNIAAEEEKLGPFVPADNPAHRERFGLEGAYDAACDAECCAIKVKVTPTDPADAESAAVVEKILNAEADRFGPFEVNAPFWREMSDLDVEVYIKEAAEQIDPEFVKALTDPLDPTKP
jgi:hypothetical protein